MKWISVEERLPDNGVRVLFTWINVLGNRRTTIGCFTRPFGICAEHEDGIDELDDEGWFDWTEHGTPYRKEGWYEEPHESEHYYPVICPVTHWMPLPPPPEENSNAD